jgi:tellurite resistance protein TerC
MPFKKIIVAMVGGTILLTGLALLVLPGPAFIVIPIGLAVLATEFVWARRWLKRARGMVNKRKARRTTRALAVTFRRRWERWKQWLAGWRERWTAGAESARKSGDGTARGTPPQKLQPPASKDAGDQAGASLKTEIPAGPDSGDERFTPTGRPTPLEPAKPAVTTSPD